MNSKLPFHKYQGAGNDFVIIDGRTLVNVLTERIINQLCDRHFGVGADGLIIVRQASEFDYQMEYFNADGREGSMCGNGARCAFMFAENMGLVSNEAEFRAYDGMHRAWSLDQGRIAVTMSDVDSVVHLSNEDYWTDTGSPHYIRFVEDLSKVNVDTEGRYIRNSDPYRANGVNVNFVEIKEQALRMSIFERGVEEITLACGTGATAVALAFGVRSNLNSGKIQLEADGGLLAVAFNRTGDKFHDIVLEGPAEHVFTGEVDLEAFDH